MFTEIKKFELVKTCLLPDECRQNIRTFLASPHPFTFWFVDFKPVIFYLYEGLNIKNSKLLFFKHERLKAKLQGKGLQAT